MSDLIIKGGGSLKDGLYTIRKGQIFACKEQGRNVRTVRTFPLEPQIRCVDCKYLELKDFVNGICKHRTGTVSPDGYCDKGEKR